MKKEDLEKLIKDNTNEEGVVDYGTVANGINEFANTIRDKGIEKAKDALTGEISSGVKNEFLKEYGFENVDQFSAFVKQSKASTDETKEALARTQKELEALKGTYDDQTSKFQEAQSKLTTIANGRIAKELGIKEDMVDYALYEAQKLVSEETDLKTVLEGFKESKATLFAEQEHQERITQVGKQAGGQQEPIKKGYERYLELKARGKI